MNDCRTLDQELSPRSVTLLEEAADCAAPAWLEQVDMASIDCLVTEVVRTIQTHYNAPNLQATATIRLLKAGLRLTQEKVENYSRKSDSTLYKVKKRN